MLFPSNASMPVGELSIAPSTWRSTTFVPNPPINNGLVRLPIYHNQDSNEHFLVSPVAPNRINPRDGLPKEMPDVIMKINE